MLISTHAIFFIYYCYDYLFGGGLIPCDSNSFSSCFTLICDMSNSCFTFQRWVSQMGSLHLWCFRISCASKTAPLKVRLFPIDKLTSAQQPPLSDFARRFRMYLKYMCSMKRSKVAKRIPAISRRNADKNCSRARGSELLCSCFPANSIFD